MRKKLFFMLIVLFSLSTIQGQQPYAGCWHPDFIKDWTPEKDKDRKFNKSSIPLQERIATATTQKAHAQQFADGQVAACLTMHPSCSQVPAQGANNFIGYNPTYWQYLDVLVWWGGSAGEGIILPPSAPVIDAAHMNGVKVLGQIFFPPTAFSGNPQWTYQMNTRDADGTYPYARKCVEIAEYYGFDGWFINSETITSTNWGEWTKDYLAYAKERGLEGQEIQLYVMSSGTSGAYIEDVAKQPGGSYMVNYNGISTTNVNNRMSSHVSNGWGDKADAFRTWYYGVEQSGSITGNGSNFNTLFPTSGHIGSINFFNPEEPIWKKTVADLLNTPNASGAMAYSAMKTVLNNEKTFWVNSKGDVTSTRSGSYSMGGLATAIQERSAIQNIPFVTTFSAGLGKHRFVNGEKRGTQDWYHRGMQTVMPTWRWWQTEGIATSTSVLSFDYNWDDAYNMGTSMDIKGNLKNSTDYVLRLYKTDFEVSEGDKLQLVYKTNKPGSVTVKMANKTNALNVQPIGLPVSTEVNGWTVDTYDLTSLAGGYAIATIALNFNAAEGSGFTAQLGQLAVYPANYNPLATEVANLEVQNTLGEEYGDLRVVWDKPASEDIHHFNVYLEREGNTSLVGQTRNEGFYIPKFLRKGQAEKSVKVTVKAVNKNMEEATSGPSQEAFFPDIALPVVTMTSSKTLVKVGEEVTVTAKATSFPEEFIWKNSENVSLVSSNGNVAVYKFEAGGLYNISVDVKNAVGTASYTEENFIKVTASGSDDLNILSLSKNGTTITESGHIGTEVSTFLIDGDKVPGSVSSKWCSSGSDGEMWVVLDLKKVYELYRFQMFDCGNKENASDNLTHYRIFTSKTGGDDDWTLVTDAKEIPATAAFNTKNDYIKPTLGRYVKLVPYNPDMPITIRLWEFEVYGIEVPIPPIIDSLTSNKKVIKTNEEVVFTVSAIGSPSSYEWTVAGGTKVAEAGKTATYTFEEEGVYSVTVKAINELGEATHTEENIVEVTNARIQALIPLAVKSGFNVDVIIEGTPADEYGQKIDDQGWAFGVTGSVVPAAGVIPADANGRLTSTNGVPFQLGAYDANNAAQIKGSGNMTLEVDGEYQAEKLYFLATGVNGSSNTVDVTINYTDGTKSAAKRVYLSDWCSSATSAIGTINRLFVSKSNEYPFENVESPAKARMFEFEMNADPTKKMASITIANGTSGVYPTFFAFTAYVNLETAKLPTPLDVEVKESETISAEATYQLNVEKEENFEITVFPEDNTIASITNVVYNDIDGVGTITFDVNGLKKGETNVIINLQNGEVKKLRTTFKVVVDVNSSIIVADISEAKVWPNPLRQGDVLNVAVPMEQTIRLLSLHGVVLLQQDVQEGVTQLPLPSIASGTYIIEFMDNNGKKVQKLIVR